ncbi:MAG: Ig-like domain-containing protein [Gammaproteobacteria bacterium]|nr:Ig-like domain-containing protein [Gammaproteobacteria bacterium]
MRKLEERVVLDAAVGVIADDVVAQENSIKAGGLEANNNQGTQVDEGATRPITSAELEFSSDRPAQNIVYTITDLPDHGQVLLDGSATNSFTQADINNGLVTYEHDGGEGTGDDGFSFDVKDDLTGEASGQFTIFVNPINDENPDVDLNGSNSGRGFIANFAEDSDPIAIVNAGQVDITDPDSDATSLQSLSIRLTNNLNGQEEFLQVDVGNTGIEANLSYSNGEALLTLSNEASIEAYEAVLNTLEYGNTANNIDTTGRVLEVTALDGVNTSDISTILINLSASNDAPAWSHPDSQAAVEETPTLISGITVADPDANGGELDVVLSVSNGTLSIPADSGLSVLEDNNTAQLHLRGTADQLNTALAELRYTGGQDFNGVDTLNLSVNDLGNTGGPALTATSSMEIDLSVPEVSAVNDAPVISAPSAITINEDNSVTFTDITISDVDAGDDVVRVQLSVPVGSLSLPSIQGLNLIQGDNGAGPTLEFEGTLNDINAALNGLVYTPPANFAGSAPINISVNDQSQLNPGALTDDHQIAVTVAPQNDAPAWTNPASQVAVEETPTLLNGISLADIDAADGVLDVTLTVSHGTLNLPQGSLSLLENNDSASIHLQGDLASINQALTELRYTGGQDFNELDELQLVVNDLGNTGGGDLVANSSMVIDLSNASVSAVNDAPVISAPTQVQINEDASVTFTDISISDVDAGDDLVQVTLSTVDGTLSLPQTDGLNFSQGNGNNNPTLVFEGTVEDVNAALDGLVFTPAVDFNGEAAINLNVDDQSQLNPGAMNDSHTITVNIAPQNDAPELVTNDTLTIVDPSSAVTITSDLLSSSDVDHADTEVQFTITALPENGELLLDGQPLAEGDMFTQADIDAGLLTYVPLNNGALADGFEFQLSDPDTVGAQAASGTPFQIVYAAPGKALGGVSTPENYTAAEDLFAYPPYEPVQSQPLVASEFGQGDNGLDMSRPDYFENAVNGINGLEASLENSALAASGINGANASGGMTDAYGSGESILRSCSEVAGLGGCNLAASDSVESRLSNTQPELLGRYLDDGLLTTSTAAPGTQQGIVEPELLTAAAECNHLNEAPQTFAGDYQQQQAESCPVEDQASNAAAEASAGA